MLQLFWMARADEKYYTEVVEEAGKEVLAQREDVNGQQGERNGYL